jgi:peptidoglycan pentaglycine glycine transferase (the first glycine)
MADAEGHEPGNGLTLRPATDADRPAWDHFVAARPEGDFLQSWAWAAACIASGEDWRRLVLTGHTGEVRGLAQLQVRRTGFGRSVLYAAHGPLWERGSADESALLDALLAGLRELGRAERAIVVKLDPRGENGGERVRDELLARGLRSVAAYLQAPTSRIVELLDGGEQMMAAWVPDARTRVRRAAKEGVTTVVDRAGDPELISAFHAIWVETSARGGFRIRSREFLLELATRLAARDEWLMALAQWQGKVVAGVVAPRIADRGYYLYAASSRDPELERKRVGYAAMAATMRALAGSGVRTLDLWGVREEGDATVDPSWAGHSSFKTRFGGTPLRHPGTFDLVVDPLWYRLRQARERLLGLARLR